MQKRFDWRKLANFLQTSVIGMLAGYYIIGLLAVIDPLFKAAVTAAFVLIDTTMVAFIIQKLKDLGLPVPNIPGLPKSSGT